MFKWSFFGGNVTKKKTFSGNKIDDICEWVLLNNGRFEMTFQGHICGFDSYNQTDEKYKQWNIFNQTI